MPAKFSRGDPFYLLIPFAVFPKQVLLDFSTADSADARVPLLARDEGARVTALHLLNLFPRQAFPKAGSEMLGAILVFETLASVTPTALLARLRAWRGDAAYNPQLADFPEWFNDEAGEFSRGLEGAVGPRYAEGLTLRASRYPCLLLRDHLTGQAARPLAGDFDCFSTLIVFAVRESLRILARRQSGGGLGGRTPRHRDLLREYRLLTSAGLRWLDRALRTAHPGSRKPRHAIEADIAQAAVSWMAYLSTEVAIERPFQLKSTELLPFEQHEWWRRQLLRGWTYHRYHVAPADARSTHIQVATEDSELLIDHRATCVGGLSWSDPRPPTEAFADHFAEAHTMEHFYSAAQPWETPLRDAPGPIELRLRYKLPTNTFAGYLLLSFSLVAVFGWSTVEWVGDAPSEVAKAGLLTVLAGLTFLLVWLTSERNTRPLVEGKVQPFRWLVAILLLALVAEPLLAWRGWL